MNIEENLKQIEGWTRGRGGCGQPGPPQYPCPCWLCVGHRAAMESLAAIRESIAEMGRQLAAIDAPGLAAVIREYATKDEHLAALEKDLAFMTEQRNELNRYTEEVKRAILPLGLRDSEWIPSAIKRAVAHTATLEAAAKERDARVADLEREVGELRSEEWCCIVCRARFGERAALSPTLPAKEPAC